MKDKKIKKFSINSFDALTTKVIIPYIEENVVQSLSDSIRKAVHKMADDFCDEIVDKYDIRAVFKENAEKEVLKEHKLEMVVMLTPKVTKKKGMTYEY